jgi:hypothetical protein
MNGQNRSRADSPRVSVTVHLELTPEEAAAMLVGWVSGLTPDNPAITARMVRPVLAQALTDAALSEVRKAARDVSESERGQHLDPEDGRLIAWCRRLVAAGTVDRVPIGHDRFSVA